MFFKTFFVSGILWFSFFKSSTAQFPLKTKISAEGNYQSGNVDRILGVARAETRATDSLAEAVVTASFAYGEQNDVKAEHNALGIFDITLYPFKTLYPFVFGSGEFNRQRSIEHRWQVGAGGGLFLLKEKTDRLKISAAIIADETQFTTSIQRGARLSFRIKGNHQVFKTPLQFAYTSFFQPALGDFNNYRATTLLTIDYPFTEIFAFRAAFEDSYENIVAPGRKQNDLRITFGISAQFE